MKKFWTLKLRISYMCYFYMYYQTLIYESEGADQRHFLNIHRPLQSRRIEHSRVETGKFIARHAREVIFHAFC